MSSKESKKISWSEWKRPIVAVALTFFCNVENSMLALGEWPYMTTIDHEATATFFGYATVASKAGHAIFAFVFALWAHQISGIKIPMLAGRCITLISCVMYIFVEFIPSNRRWWLLVCYVLFGIGFGTSALLRSYIARVTSEANRSTAYALQNGAMVLSIVVGPATSSSKFSFATIKGQLSRIRSLKLPWLLVILVIAEKMVSGLFGGSLGATAGPMMSSMMALSGEEIVMIMAISQIICGLLAAALALLFILCKVGQRVNCSALLVFSNCVIISGYILTYPYPFTSLPLQPFNETTRTGCNPLEYTWCNSQQVINVIPFIIGVVVMSHDHLRRSHRDAESRHNLLKNHRKHRSGLFHRKHNNVMQSLFIIAEDVMQIVAPIYASAVFTAIGINFVQIIIGSVDILATVVCLAAWKWLEPYK